MHFTTRPWSPLGWWGGFPEAAPTLQPARAHLLVKASKALEEASRNKHQALFAFHTHGVEAPARLAPGLAASRRQSALTGRPEHWAPGVMRDRRGDHGRDAWARPLPFISMAAGALARVSTILRRWASPGQPLPPGLMTPLPRGSNYEIRHQTVAFLYSICNVMSRHAARDAISKKSLAVFRISFWF